MAKDNLNKKQLEAIKYIRNCLAHGVSPSIREIQRVLRYSSPRSAALILDVLISRKIVKRRLNGRLQLLRDIEETLDNARTVEIPLVGAVACGTPVLAEENVEAMIPVSKTLVSPGQTYFLLRASGDSMDMAGINDGDLLLIRQQSVAEEGQKVVALIDDESTVKEFHRVEGAVILKPKSSNPIHQPIILTEDFIIQGVVIKIFPSLN